ncbi:MAG: hypothetical protein F7B18_02855 [Desulfurococcales archaeon]|nr:hypothetical protein [Desulfurococcales archaeon]
MDGPRNSILAMPRRVTILNLAVNITIAIALLILYIGSGDRGILLVLLIIALLTPIDLTILYAMFKTNSQQLLEALKLVEEAGPSIIIAPLGLKVEAAWWKPDAVYVLHYTPRHVYVVRVKYARIREQAHGALSSLLPRRTMPVKPGNCTWAHWTGRGRMKTPTPRGIIVEVEGLVEAWAYACNGTPPTIIREALTKAGLNNS